ERARRSISADIVAENRSVCRFVGSIASTRLMAGRKPMSSMRSASSRTRTSSVDRSTALRSVRSSRRPGVAITTLAPHPQVRDLGANVRAADHDHAAVTLDVIQLAVILLNLECELARRSEHQHAHSTSRAFTDLLNDGK